MAKPTRERVAMTHPAGRPTVLVSPTRAATLRERGYTNSSGEITSAGVTQPARLERAVLIERAKAVGVPAKGTNEALLAAVVTAEGRGAPDGAGTGDDAGDGGA